MSTYILQKKITGPDVQNFEGFIDAGSEFIKTSIYSGDDYYLNGKYGGYKLEARFVENNPEWFKSKGEKCEIKIKVSAILNASSGVPESNRHFYFEFDKPVSNERIKEKQGDICKVMEFIINGGKIVDGLINGILSVGGTYRLTNSDEKWTDADMADFMYWFNKENDNAIIFEHTKPEFLEKINKITSESGRDKFGNKPTFFAHDFAQNAVVLWKLEKDKKYNRISKNID